MTAPAVTELVAAVESADAACAVAESLEIGSAWSSPVEAVKSAIAAIAAITVSVLFPIEITSMPADAIAAFAWHTGRLAAAGYGEALASIHRRAMNTFPALAALCRSADAVSDVGASAAQFAAPADQLEPHAAAGARAAADACARYQRAIAAQLVDAPDELGAAARALVHADDLSARLTSTVARHEAHAAAELERVDAEQRAAARAIAEESARRVRDAEAAASEATAAAKRAANDLRLAHADALVARLRARLEAASRTKDRARRGELEALRTRETLHDVESVIANARGMSAERIAWFTAALDQAQAQGR
jgi:hypothetical protein